MKKAALAVFYALSILVAMEFAAHSAMKNQMAGFEMQLQKTQGELALRHLLRYIELEQNLEKGCKAAAIEKIKISVAIESSLLASILEGQKTSDLSKYIAKQSPGLEQKLVGYKNPFGSSWREPECN